MDNKDHSYEVLYLVGLSTHCNTMHGTYNVKHRNELKSGYSSRKDDIVLKSCYGTKEISCGVLENHEGKCRSVNGVGFSMRLVAVVKAKVLVYDQSVKLINGFTSKSKKIKKATRLAIQRALINIAKILQNTLKFKVCKYQSLQHVTAQE